MTCLAASTAFSQKATKNDAVLAQLRSEAAAIEAMDLEPLELSPTEDQPNFYIEDRDHYNPLLTLFYKDKVLLKAQLITGYEGKAPEVYTYYFKNDKVFYVSDVIDNDNLMSGEKIHFIQDYGVNDQLNITSCYARDTAWLDGKMLSKRANKKANVLLDSFSYRQIPRLTASVKNRFILSELVRLSLLPDTKTLSKVTPPEGDKATTGAKGENSHYQVVVKQNANGHDIATLTDKKTKTQFDIKFKVDANELDYFFMGLTGHYAILVTQTAPYIMGLHIYDIKKKKVIFNQTVWDNEFPDVFNFAMDKNRFYYYVPNLDLGDAIVPPSGVDKGAVERKANDYHLGTTLIQLRAFDFKAQSEVVLGNESYQVTQ